MTGLTILNFSGKGEW